MTRPPLTAIVSAALLTAILTGCSASRGTGAGSVSCNALGLVAGDPALADLERQTRETIAGNNVAIARNCPGRAIPGVDLNSIWRRR